MSLDGTQSHDITLAEASAMTSNYRSITPLSQPIAHFFGKGAIEKILTQNDCIGIRIYYGLDVDQKKQLIIVGVDESGDDICEGYLAERSIACPTVCSSGNPLNSDY
jgi:hypothetical protein